MLRDGTKRYVAALSVIRSAGVPSSDNNQITKHLYILFRHSLCLLHVL